MAELLSLLEMSKRLDVPESTLRRWKNRFEEYLPTVGSGRTTRYKPDALEALRLIQSLAAEDAPWEDIESALAAGFARTVEASSPDSASSSPAVTALGEMVGAIVQVAVTEASAGLRRAIDDARRERDEAIERLRLEQEARDVEFQRLLNERLPPREAKRVRLRERLRRALGR